MFSVPRIWFSKSNSEDQVRIPNAWQHILGICKLFKCLIQSMCLSWISHDCQFVSDVRILRWLQQLRFSKPAGLQVSATSSSYKPFESRPGEPPPFPRRDHELNLLLSLQRAPKINLRKCVRHVCHMNSTFFYNVVWTRICFWCGLQFPLNDHDFTSQVSWCRRLALATSLSRAFLASLLPSRTNTMNFTSCWHWNMCWKLSLEIINPARISHELQFASQCLWTSICFHMNSKLLATIPDFTSHMVSWFRLLASASSLSRASMASLLLYLTVYDKMVSNSMAKALCGEFASSRICKPSDREKGNWMARQTRWFLFQKAFVSQARAVQ